MNFSATMLSKEFKGKKESMSARVKTNNNTNNKLNDYIIQKIYILLCFNSHSFFLFLLQQQQQRIRMSSKSRKIRRAPPTPTPTPMATSSLPSATIPWVTGGDILVGDVMGDSVVTLGGSVVPVRGSINGPV